MAKFNIEGVWYEANSYKDAREMSKTAVGDMPAPATREVVRSIAPPHVKKAVAAPSAALPNTGTIQPAVAHVSKPFVLAHNTQVAPALMTISKRPAAAIPDGKIRVLHRADSRKLDHSSILRDRGFGCQSGMWQIRERACSRMFIKKLLNPSLSVSGVQGFDFAAEVLTPVARNTGTAGGGTMTLITLSDVAATIKRVLKDTRAFWISTSVNSACGGYATRNDYNTYRFTLPVALNQYELVQGDKTNTLVAVDRRTSDTVPTICFDGAPDGSEATVVGLNIGPLDDCEVSLLTHIKMPWVEVLNVATT